MTTVYEQYKIDQFQKPYRFIFNAFVDKLGEDRQDVTANYATEAWVSGQISSGGVDWSTFGNPLDIITLDLTGTTPTGMNYATLASKFDAALFDWTAIGDADDVIKINSTNDGIEGMTYSELATALGVVSGGTTVFQTMGGWY